MTTRLPDDCFALPPGVDWTPVDTALARLRDGLHCVTGTEEVRLTDAAGRILVAPATAQRANPPQSNSAIDGYAFAWTSLRGQSVAELPLQPGRAAAGHPFAGTVAPGHALRILTGADMPAGTDTVVLQEDATVGAGQVRFAAPRKQGANCRPAGEDARAGEKVLPGGRRLGPADLARLAAVGIARLEVHTRLRVGVLSTGDELIQPGADPAAPGIFDANRPMLMAAVEAFGHSPVDLGFAPDRSTDIRAALERGAATTDAIVTSGGASAGDEDHISRLLRQEGQVATWRIAVKPGRPLALGLWRGVPVFGLPGNPVAAWVCALIFARPALALMAGTGWTEPQAFLVPASFEKRKKAGRREFLRARLNADGNVEVFPSEGSGLVGSLSWAEGLVDLAEEATDISPGTPVRYLPYASFGLGT